MVNGFATLVSMICTRSPDLVVREVAPEQKTVIVLNTFLLVEVQFTLGKKSDNSDDSSIIPISLEAN